MKDKITVIIPIRNREAWRIENQVKSIREHGGSPTILLVDYGSFEHYSQQYNQICTNLNINYLYIYAEGRPWSRSHAINCGVKKANTPFIVTSDADMLYGSNTLQWCLDNYSQKNVYQHEIWNLNKSSNKLKAKKMAQNKGAFQFIEKEAFIQTGGYDENMLYWGEEDFDWSNRLMKLGYKQEWLPLNYVMYHQWHTISESNNKRPITATINSARHSTKNIFSPVIKQNWGNPYLESDRPILKLLQNNAVPQTVQIKPQNLIMYEVRQSLVEGNTHGFVKLDLGSRLIKRPLDILRNPIKRILKPFSALTGNKIISNINSNFDTLYELIPIWLDNGMIDYYIDDNLETVYLLWE